MTQKQNNKQLTPTAVDASKVCASMNRLLTVELAAAEVCGLAAKLLGDLYGSFDYDALEQAHAQRATALRQLIEAYGGQPRTSELSWDRPHSAILTAATIYGSESPLAALSDQEQEIYLAYERFLGDCGSDDSLRRRVREQFIADAEATWRRVETVSNTSQSALENFKVLGNEDLESCESRDAVA